MHKQARGEYGRDVRNTRIYGGTGRNGRRNGRNVGGMLGMVDTYVDLRAVVEGTKHLTRTWPRKGTGAGRRE